MYLAKKSLSKEEKKKVGCSAARPHNCLRLAPPQCYPPPGIYEANELRVSISCPTFSSANKNTASASVHAAAGDAEAVKFAYTLDGTPPMFTKTVNHHISILSSDKEPLVLRGRGVYIIRVVSCKEGLVESKISDFAFRLVGDSNNNNKKNNHNPFPTPLARDGSNKNVKIPALFGVPMYDRFAAEKSEAKHSMTTTSKSMTPNTLLSAAHNHSSASSLTNIKNNNNNNNNNVSSSSSTGAVAPLKVCADSTSICAVRDANTFREKGSAVVTQNPNLATQVVSEIVNEQIRQSLAGTRKVPLPISAIDGDTISLVMPNQIVRDPSPYYSGSASKNKNHDHNNNNNEMDVDLSGISLPLANALAQRSKIETDELIHNNNNATNNNTSLNNISNIHHHHHQSRSRNRSPNTNSNQNHNVSSVMAASHILEDAASQQQQDLSFFNNTTNNIDNHQSPSRNQNHQVRSSMKFGSGTRGPLSASPNASTLSTSLPRAATSLGNNNSSNHHQQQPSSSFPKFLGKKSKKEQQAITDSLPPRSVTPALQRMYSQPLDSSAYGTPLTKLLGPVLPEPRRDATLKGNMSQNAAVGATSSSAKLSIEEINARRREIKDQKSAGALKDFAKVASEVPAGTPLFGAREVVRKMDELASKESGTLGHHSETQLLWYEAREDALKKKKRYVQKEVDSDASFNELMLTHDPTERAQEREYIKKVTNSVAESQMCLPPVQANDYNCTATSFFPGSDIAQTSAPFLKFMNSLDEITPFLKNILRHVSYDSLHAKLESDAIRETYKQGLPADLNALFGEYSLPHTTCFIPSNVSMNSARRGASVGHLLLALRWCVWNHFRVAEAPMLLLLQYCALIAHPGTYTLGTEWEEVKQFMEHDGEINHFVSTTVPHVAFEMAVSLFRKNLDKMHMRQLMESKKEQKKQELEANLAASGVFVDNNNNNNTSLSNNNNNTLLSSTSMPSSGSFRSGSFSLLPKKNSAVSKRIAEDRLRTIRNQLSQDTLKQNAEKRDRIREADALTTLVPWKTSADANNNANNAPPPAAPSPVSMTKDGSDPAKGNNNTNNNAQRWGQNTATTFIQDVYLAQILYQMEPKLPRLYDIVKKASDVTWDIYCQSL